MSWDVMIMNYGGEPPDFASDDEEPDPLGPGTQVRESISRHLPGVDWSDPTWGTYASDEFTIEFNVDGSSVVDTIMLHVRGGGDPLSAILRFSKPNKWSLLDTTSGEFVDADDASSEGWNDFQQFRDSAADQFPDSP